MTFGRRALLGALGAPLLLPRVGGAASGLRPLAAALLRDWCDALLRVQIDDPGKPQEHGAFRCPACPKLHGRCGDAVYPLLHLAKTTGQARYLRGALEVVGWMKNVESLDGAWVNDPNDLKSWKGITVFGAIAMGEAVRHHGDLLDREVKQRWLERLRAAGRFIHDQFKMDYGNINYPVTAAYALTLLGELLDEPRYRARGRQFAHDALAFITRPSRLLYGEGQPQAQRSPKGLCPVDLGYNVEESLPALALYALATRDGEVLEAVTAALAAHLEFMLPDGGWDNSWGTRNYKWTYWGSRTSDGCQTAYALLADRHPAFATAALRNTQLLGACTRDGLLHGGPHYAEHQIPPCVHHTFCHAKALATVLDHPQVPGKSAPLPRETASGVRTVPELDVILVARGPWRATVSGYDWLYKKKVFSGMGGALSLLWHRELGPLFTASLASYLPVEPNNMQLLAGEPDFSLTPRVETHLDGQWFSNIFDPGATLRQDGLECAATARLVDATQKDPAIGTVKCQLRYRFTDAAVTLSARVTSPAPGAARFSLILPIIAAPSETLRRASPRRIEVSKGRSAVVVEASVPLGIVETGHPRVFNLVPGFCAVPLVIALPPGEAVECTIRKRT